MEVSLAGQAVIMAADEILTVWLLGASLVKHHTVNCLHLSHNISFSRPGILERRQEVSEAEQPQYWEDRSAQTSAEDCDTDPGL